MGILNYDEFRQGVNEHAIGQPINADIQQRSVG